jgi:hypothetical protein
MKTSLAIALSIGLAGTAASGYCADGAIYPAFGEGGVVLDNFLPEA